MLSGSLILNKLEATDLCDLCRRWIVQTSDSLDRRPSVGVSRRRRPQRRDVLGSKRRDVLGSERASRLFFRQKNFLAFVHDPAAGALFVIGWS